MSFNMFKVIKYVAKFIETIRVFTTVKIFRDNWPSLFIDNTLKTTIDRIMFNRANSQKFKRVITK